MFVNDCVQLAETSVCSWGGSVLAGLYLGFIRATGPPRSFAEAPGEPASCMSMAVEQSLQAVPGSFNPPIQECQAVLLTGSCTASY